MPTRHFTIILLTLLLVLFLRTQGTLKERVFYYALHKIEKTSLEPTTEEKLLNGAFDGMMKTSLYYPYSAYLPPAKEEVYEDEINGEYRGIGLQRLQMDATERELWFTPIYGSPAQRAGLRFGDRLVQIDGEDFAGEKSVNKIFDDLEKKKGEKIRATVRPLEAILAAMDEDGAESAASEDTESELQEIEITRGQVHQEIVLGDRRLENGEWDYSLETHPNLGYIRIDQFTDSTEEDFRKAFETAIQGKVEGLILDLRWNPGGFLHGAFHLCDYFLPAGSEIVTVRNRNGEIKKHYEATKGEKWLLPLVVLVNGESASASEIVAAALADHRRAKLIGSRTYGKGTVQELFSLPCEMGLLRLTNASFWRPSGQPIHRQKGAGKDQVWGVLPDEDGTVPLTEAEDYGVLLFRDLRSYPLSLEERERMKGIVTRRMKAADKEIREETDSSLEKVENGGESSRMEPALSGSAPYYDRQLDKAIEFLTAEINEK